MAVFTQLVKSSEEWEASESSDVLVFHSYQHFPWTCTQASLFGGLEFEPCDKANSNNQGEEMNNKIFWQIQMMIY